MGDIVVFEVPLEAWLSGGVVLIALLFVLWIAALLRIGKLRKRLNAFVKDTGVPDLESVMKKLHERVEGLTAQTESNAQRIGVVEARAERWKTNVGVVRYNPFGERGSDLSFSVAFVDERKDGVVISALHSRDESRVYAKPLEAGTSGYPLTPEEKEAIIQAKPKA
ncbi:DUF4446 family protein [Paenibacillus sp.]|uniref:DUF4446 family protein n=1 Tax=Paenibacillus sp. TaxID=58172 RepID=UPI002D4E15AF|nr:DUF4446 family protein [Paenibacillus sp.]HZG57285.1 DUF4446 family protein [Paenibacillus sp.]